MSNADIYQKLAPIFHEVFDDDEIIPTPEMTANDVEDWDSLSHIRLLVAVEETFEIAFSSSEISSLKNVGELVAAITGKFDT